MDIAQNNHSSLRSSISNFFTAGKIKGYLSSLALQLLVPVVFVLIVFLFFPYSATFEFSTDEGINLMKGMLVDRGYSLYSEIWSDQPPLFTYLLAFAFQLFGLKVGVARFVVLVLSSILLWASFQFARTVSGTGFAFATGVVLFLLPKYMILSVAAMVGLPAISLAVLSLLFITFWHQQRKYHWLILSSIALGLSIHTKLFTGFLAPIFVLGLLINEYIRRQETRSWRKILIPAVLWGVIFSVLSLGLGLTLVGPNNVSQLLEPHVTATQVGDFSNNETLTIQWHLKQAKVFMLIAIIGTVLVLRSKRWLYLYPLAWMVTAYLLLSQHAPVWEHQQLLVTIPAAILGGIAVYEAVHPLTHIIRSYYDKSWSGLLRAVAFIGAFSFIFTFRVAEPISLLSPQPSLTNSDFDMGPRVQKFFVKMLKFAPETNWVVTDLPMYPFRARLPVPPNLAVFSSKRVETGNLTEEQVLDTIREYNPEQVLLGRFQFPIIEIYLRGRYRLVHSDDYTKLYIRNDLGG